MLKIKDNIDLKELENFGFEKLNYCDCVCYKFARIIGTHEIRNLIIREQDLILHYNINSVYNILDDIVFDLIQAGLVEKV